MSLARWDRWSAGGRLGPIGVLAILASVVAGVAAQQGGGAAAGAPRGGIDPILVGAIDIHAHSGPDSRGRAIDFLDAARYARLRGMRGMVFKHHKQQTAGYAFIARKEVPGLEVFGTLDLNKALGGMNPDAVEEFVHVTMPGFPPNGYGRMVMLGSDDTPHQIEVSKRSDAPVIVVRNGQVVPEAITIMQLIKKYDLSLTTGHHNGEESVIIVREAIRQGISPQRIGVTHANLDPPGLTVEQMQAVANMGAFVEIGATTQRGLTPEAQMAVDAKNDRVADMIRKVGPEHIIIESDLGLASGEFHPDGLSAFARSLWARGITQADTDIMMKRNPARFLGLPETAAGTR